MNLKNKHTAVIGAGVAGLTAADELGRLGIKVSLYEKTPFLGGHAVQLNCKATDTCVKCGACVAEEKLLRATQNPNVTIHTGTQIQAVSMHSPYQIEYRVHSPLVNADQCDGCGLCFQKCPVPGALLKGRTPRVGPYVAIRRDLCRYFSDQACTLCRDACPRGAIRLSTTALTGTRQADAILVTTGFTPFNPMDKPYGYGQFPNVVTSLDAERILREHGVIKRPSDGKTAQRIAFIQCVGSRDARLGHLWCSKICCGSSLRMARLIQSRQTQAHISFFYIDVQTFGKDFQRFYTQACEKIDMIRAIPGDIFRTDGDELEVVYFNPESKKSEEALFDVVVLSVGLLPSADNRHIADTLNWSLDANGFVPSHKSSSNPVLPGVFSAGAARGPMTIAESISSAEKTVYEIIQYLGGLD
ncbi:MAG: FAD-dependent oxidoreductase [Desulfobacteraceae bacterium]